MKFYAVIDTNVVLSSMISRNSEAATARVMKAVMQNKLIPLYNTDILLEYSDVLHRPQFNLREEDVQRMIEGIIRRGCMANRVPGHDVVKDPKDVVFYEVALSREEAYLVTGNIKDFPQTPIVVTPSEMVKILEDNGLIEPLKK